MLLHDVLAVLDRIAPLRHAEPWDNVGLLAGDPDSEIHRALLAIDLTPAVFDEAARHGCELVIAYHPPLFEAIKRVSSKSPVHRAIRDGIALYSPHTALDVAPGGTNDLLADILGLGARSPLKLAPARETAVKLVTFVPEPDIERVAEAVFEAGAGVIGQYSNCSFRTTGTGTFVGDDTTRPLVGEPGQRQSLSEVRLETVLPLARQDAVIEALRAAHPYEEVAFDLVRLAPRSEGVGIGRTGTFDAPVSREELIERVKRGLGVSHVLVAGPTTGPVRRVAVCAGAGRGLLSDALAAKADLFLTGELPHHDALRAAAAGMTVVCALHSNSERATLPRVRRRLEEEAPGLTVRISAEDRDPYVLC
ncbi:MAG: Nif3-like dinuclear metal center hexameric protein [Polyangiaceae bacterium]